ncbi:MAG: rhomboid family intramembrane serine protease [Spirochaetota bacterium]
MILPIGDDNRDRTTVPYVTYAFLLVNVVVFAFLQQFGANAEFTYSYSAVPEEIVTGRDLITEGRVYSDPVTGSRYRVPGLGPTPITVYITLITSMFMHGGFAHIVGNMLYLWIFGDNVEDRVGHVRFALFYLLCGAIATLSHVFATYALGGSTTTPMLGASGAVSAVLGAYLLLFPRKRVRVILLRILMSVPAWFAIVLWFAFQLISGVGAFGAGSQAGGVAYAAHIGGFIAGAILIWLFAIGRPRGRRRSGGSRGGVR